jgi:hypothetical protein
VILPLYDRHQQLARESLSRKIGSLREALAVALKARLDHPEEPAECAIDRDAIDSGLRTAVGRMAEVREACLAMTHDVRSQAGDALTDAATRLTDIDIEWKPGLFSKLSRNLAIRQAEKALERQIGERVSEAFSTFGSILDAWARRTLSEMQLRFETPAESYRAHLDRIGARGKISVDEISVIERDLALLRVDT